jgi:hypothetical protein
MPDSEWPSESNPSPELPSGPRRPWVAPELISRPLYEQLAVVCADRVIDLSPS